MPLTPIDWSVVIVGSWNRAILTPSGIARHLFGLAEGTPVDVMVPLDAIAAPVVKHNRLLVAVSDDRLAIQIEDPTFDRLQQAMECGFRAMQQLPVTPIGAVGFNVNYHAESEGDYLRTIAGHEELDARLGENGFTIASRSVVRTLEYNEGKLKLTLVETPELTYNIQFNFERKLATDPAAYRLWLQMPVEDIERTVKSILFNCFNIPETSFQHVQAI